MIKKRALTKSNVTIEDFVAGAGNTPEDTKIILDPKAARKFKSHTIPMNEYEYLLLSELAAKYGQTHSGIIRYALKQLSEDTQ